MKHLAPTFRLAFILSVLAAASASAAPGGAPTLPPSAMRGHGAPGGRFFAMARTLGVYRGPSADRNGGVDPALVAGIPNSSFAELYVAAVADKASLGAGSSFDSHDAVIGAMAARQEAAAGSVVESAILSAAKTQGDTIWAKRVTTTRSYVSAEEAESTAGASHDGRSGQGPDDVYDEFGHGRDRSTGPDAVIDEFGGNRGGGGYTDTHTGEQYPHGVF